MSSFETTEDPRYHDLFTTLDGGTFDKLTALRDFGLRPITDSVRRLIHAHRVQHDISQRGGLMIADTGQALEVLTPRLPRSEDRALWTASMRVSVANKDRAYLEPMTYAYDREDLIGFWWSAMDFYTRLEDLHTQDAKMHLLLPGVRRMGGMTLQSLIEQ